MAITIGRLRIGSLAGNLGGSWNITPPTPTVTINSNTSLTVDWVITGLDKTVTAVELWHSTDGTTYTRLVKLGAVATYDHDGLENNSIHYYKVRYYAGVYVSGFSEVVSGTTFITAAYNYFVAMSTQLSQAQKLVINAAIKSTATQLAKMDYVNIALATEQQSLINLVNPAQSGTKVGSPTFTAYKGWTGNETNHIDTGFNPGDGGSYNLTRNNTTISFYSNKYIDLDNSLWAGNNGTAISGLSIGIYRDKRRVLGGINDDGSYFVNTGVYIKEFLVNRRDGSSSSYRNFNLHNIPRSIESAAVLNSAVKIALTENRGALFFAGSFLDDGELSSFMNAWLPVLEHLGSDYWSNFTPTTLTATAGAGKIDLAWTLPVTTYSPYTVTNVVIQESEDNVTFTDIATLGAVEAYEATVPTGRTRYYKIRYISSRNIHTTNSAEAHATAL